MNNQGFHPKWKFPPMALQKTPIPTSQWSHSHLLLIDEAKEWCKRRNAHLQTAFQLLTTVKEVFMEGARKQYLG